MERSTALNKNLKPSCLQPPRGGGSAEYVPESDFFRLLILSIAGCGTLSATRVPWEAERPDGCQALFERLDAVVLEKGVHDAADAPVAGFPYLRANRFVASLAGGLSEPAAKTDWVQWMRELDLAARDKEIANLPDDAVRTLAASRDELAGRVAACSQTLYDADRVRPDFYEVLGPRVAVPDEYSNALRLAGLYPLVTIPEYKITERVRERFRAWYEMPYEKLPAEGTLRVYSPPQGTGRDAREVIAASRRNPLGIPRPSAGEARELAVRYAPVIIQDETAPYDRVGRIVWKGDELTVDGEKPAVYYYLSHARVKGEPVLQVNYAFWYPARAGRPGAAIEHGRLDGLTLRLSFDTRGTAVHDRSHEQLRLLPRLHPGEGPGGSGRSGATTKTTPSPPRGSRRSRRGNRPPYGSCRDGTRSRDFWRWRLRRKAFPMSCSPTRRWRAWPGGTAGSASIFDAEGIAKGSERVERFIFFPTGIPSIGSMRQRGHHAITLSGRTHFDEPGLFEHYFVFR